MSLAAASKHIKLLERAGLLQRSVQGRVHVCRLDAAPLHAGVEWLRHYEQFWNARLDALETLLAAEDAPGKKATTKRTATPKAAKPTRSSRTEKRR